MIMDHTEQAALPEHVNIIGEFQPLSNSYIVDRNIFVKGDVLMNGRERYTMLNDPLPYGDTDSTYWVIILDKPIPKAVGTMLIK